MPLTPGEDAGDWPELHRERRALVVVDVVESVRLMQQHEDEFIDRWRRFVHEVRTEVLPQHGGRLVKSLGDGMLMEFAHAPTAIAAALEIQARVARHNIDRNPDTVLLLRAGAHLADVVVTELDVFGTGPNLAARLATLAPPGGLVASAEMRDAMTHGVHADVQDLGECFLKHITEPVRAFALHPCGAIRVKTNLPGDNLAAHRPVVAVVPFYSRSAQPDHDALGDAIADDVIAGLSRSADLLVLSRLSTGVFGRTLTSANAGATMGLMQTAREQWGADYVLSGTVVLLGNRLRINAEFAETLAGAVLWCDVLFAQMDDFFAGQDQAITSIVGGISRAVRDEQVRRVKALPIPHLDGYTLYLGGVSLLHRLSRNDFLQAHDIFDQLAERIPRSASPYAMLAKWHIFRMVQGWSEDRGQEGIAARDSARKALDRDPDDAVSLAMQGLAHTIVDGRLSAAEESYLGALAANPQEPYAWAFMSGYLSYRDRPAEA